MRAKTKNVAIPIVLVLTAIVSGAFGFYANADSTLTGLETNTITGHVTLTLYDADDNVKNYVQTDNLIVDDGLDTMADIIHGEIDENTSGGSGCGTNGCNGSASDTPFTFLEIGTATAVVAAGDTVLGASACARQQDNSIAGDSSTTGETVVELEITFTGAAGCTGDITEAGVFNASSGEEMLAHKTFSPITVGATDSLKITWRITYT